MRNTPQPRKRKKKVPVHPETASSNSLQSQPKPNEFYVRRFYHRLHFYCNSGLFICGSARKSKHKPSFKLKFLEVSETQFILQRFATFSNVIVTFAAIFLTFCNFLTLQLLAKSSPILRNFISFIMQKSIMQFIAWF